MPQEPPITGDPTIDAALRRVADAAELGGEEQAKVLGDAQTVLQNVLRSSRQDAQVPVPSTR